MQEYTKASMFKRIDVHVCETNAGEANVKWYDMPRTFTIGQAWRESTSTLMLMTVHTHTHSYTGHPIPSILMIGPKYAPFTVLACQAWAKPVLPHSLQL